MLLALVLAPAASSAADNVEKFVAADALNVRAEPSLDAPVVGKLPRGAKVQAGADSGKWTRVEFDGQSGWAWSELLSDQPVAGRPARHRSAGTERAAASDDGTRTSGSSSSSRWYSAVS
ncbi:MAG: SH3 domain-containing protein [Myxococcales bacterium]|nr:SH3 domain-containing protein [Myxococcales bacterium]